MKNDCSVCAARWIDLVALDPADPAALHRMPDGMEHAEAHDQGSVCTTTSADPRDRSCARRSSIALARPCAVGERAAALEREREEDDDAVVGAHEPQLARRRAGLLAHDAARRRPRRCRSPRLGGLSASGSRCVLHGLDLGHGGQDRALDLLGDLVRALEREVARKLQMERDLDAPVDLEHGQVVDLAHLRDGERGREHSLADLRLAASRLDVHDDVDAGQRVAQRLLDAVRCSVPLADRRAGRDADDDVGEVRSTGLAHAQPSQLDRRIELGDRPPRALARRRPAPGP